MWMPCDLPLALYMGDFSFLRVQCVILVCEVCSIINVLVNQQYTVDSVYTVYVEVMSKYKKKTLDCDQSNVYSSSVIFSKPAFSLFLFRPIYPPLRNKCPVIIESEGKVWSVSIHKVNRIMSFWGGERKGEGRKKRRDDFCCFSKCHIRLFLDMNQFALWHQYNQLSAMCWWRFGLLVMSLGTSTKLLYVELG